MAQKTAASIRKGNEWYHQQNFDAAKQAYSKALTYNAKDPVAHYNNGNAQYRTKQLEEAAASFDNTIANTSKKSVQEKAFYNKGVALIKQKKLEESIAAWKEALKRDAADVPARENLQKALLDLKQQQKDQKEKEKEEEKKNDKPKPEKQQQQPPPPQSKLNKQQVEQLLKSMQQKEKEIQKRLQNSNPSMSSKPEKDW